jgi:hypothetical protein
MQLEGLGSGMVRCAAAESACLPLGENSGRGAVHFDNIWNAIISIYQVRNREMILSMQLSSALRSPAPTSGMVVHLE